MTPERLNELAGIASNFETYCLMNNGHNVQNEIATFLRECAKCEPVYMIAQRDCWFDIDKSDYDFNNLSVTKKRILYTAPNPVKVPDELILAEREACAKICDDMAKQWAATEANKNE
jgi:hypothetical protein